jgi:hypothetical protein
MSRFVSISSAASSITLIPFLRRPHILQHGKLVDVDALFQQRRAHLLVGLVSDLHVRVRGDLNLLADLPVDALSDVLTATAVVARCRNSRRTSFMVPSFFDGDHFDESARLRAHMANPAGSRKLPAQEIQHSHICEGVS